MPVTAGHVPGLTSRLHRVRTDPLRFHSGRWWLLAEGVLVSAFGIAGLVAAALNPHAGRTGAPVLGLATTPTNSAMLLAFGVAAVAATWKRRAAVTVTAVSAVAYLMLLFTGSIASARGKPTLLGFHPADILLYGLLGVANLALLMWLIPDELGDEAWLPRRRRGRDSDRRQPPAAEAVAQPATVSPTVAPATKPKPRPAPGAMLAPKPDTARERPSPPPSPTNDPPAEIAEKPTPSKRATAGSTNRLLSRGVVAVAVLVAIVGVVVWMRRR
jgi:hypothetical protein